jgi:2-polyprenyl-6-methoxyphenol hydroxylase-like FAD-dependent oxidoreductase
MTEHAVVIAGGGPTGLMLAGEWASAGVDVAIVERRAGFLGVLTDLSSRAEQARNRKGLVTALGSASTGLHAALRARRRSRRWA